MAKHTRRPPNNTRRLALASPICALMMSGIAACGGGGGGTGSGDDTGTTTTEATGTTAAVDTSATAGIDTGSDTADDTGTDTEAPTEDELIALIERVVGSVEHLTFPDELDALPRPQGTDGTLDETFELTPEKVDLGLRSAVSQVSQVLGPRPFLGRSGASGWDVVAGRSTPIVVAVIGIVAVVVAAAAWWQRRDRRFVAAAAMVGVLAVAGVVTGMNIPDSPEQGRLNFFHWAFVLSFFWILVLGWLGARLAPVLLPNTTHGRRSTAAVVALVVVVGVALTPLVVDRRSDRLVQPLPTDAVGDLVAQLRSDEEVAALDEPVLVLVNGDDRFIQAGDTVGARLDIDGLDVRFPRYSTGFVHPSRIADACAVDRYLVVSLGRGAVDPPPGREVASVDAAPGLDREALARLVAAADDVDVVLGEDLTAALGELPGDQGDLIGATLDFQLPFDPPAVLLSRTNLELLLAHPLASPALDPDDLQSLLDSLPSGATGVTATDVSVHLLDRIELEAWDPAALAPC